MAYADFSFYHDEYLGTAISETAFPRLALRASAVIDQITFGRASTDTENTDAISMACCAIAEEIQAVELNGNEDGIASESVGGHSVSYNVNSVKQLTKQERYLEAAKLYLSNTGLLFAGFADGEHGDSL